MDGSYLIFLFYIVIVNSIVILENICFFVFDGEFGLFLFFISIRFKFFFNIIYILYYFLIFRNEI